MHKVSRVRVENFRCCANVTIELDTFTPLIGPNNVGKSTLLSALSWALEPASLGLNDFGDVNKPVQVEILATGLDATTVGRLDPGHQKKATQYLNNETILIRRTCDQPEAKSRVEFRDPKVASESDPDAWAVNPTGIWNAIKALFPSPIRIGAMVDAAEDASKNKSTTTLGQLIAEIAGDVTSQVAPTFKKLVDGISDQLSADGSARPSELTDFDQEASLALQDFFQGVSLKLHISCPSLSDLFKSGTLFLYDGNTKRPFTSMGHGAQRAVQMALVRVLADRQTRQGGSSQGTKLLLIDEPELYLHPNATYTLRDALRKLSASGYQVVFTTHSPMMVEEAVAESTAIVGKDASKGTFVRPTIKAAVANAIKSAPHQASHLFSLNHASEILFANKVIIAEGKTERRLLPELFREIRGASARSLGIATVSIDGVAGAAKTREILTSLGLESKIIADLDYAFRGAISAGWIQNTDSDIIQCKKLLKTLQATYGWKLDADGLPEGNKAMSAAAIFEGLARDSTAATAIKSLHQKLLNHNVWVWTRGAIEPHLGIASKKEHAFAQFLSDVKTNGARATISDYASVESCLSWMAS
ncbi:MAG: ATP-dependent endonuclease [Planctomycetes bacterium]|nr:ATP-dependent endonuclease [Planctomycetota bacterium]